MKLQVLMPASLFGSILGIAGLASAWRASASVWNMPAWPAMALTAVAVLAWLAGLVLYLAKWAVLPAQAREEAGHPVQGNFLMMIPVSSMLVAMLLQPYAATPARALYVLAMTGAVVLSVWQQGNMMQGGRAAGTATAALYIPTVAAGFVGAIGAAAFGWQTLAQLFFGAGLLAWLALESVLLNRMMHGDAMPPAMRASFGVQLAPPSVGLLALFAAWDAVPAHLALILFGYALAQLLLAARLLRWLLAGGFGPAFWSFAFGITALSTGAWKLAAGGLDIAQTLAPWLFLLANGVVGIVAAYSLWLMGAGKLLPRHAPFTRAGVFPG
ncbi:dicarboxylate transporter/tellurite-resistance protein TehA [Telluria aromaticivorans]|uniref:Dicarboxylate transporter/tellurite-resistance protein TehA n=1 Tax=Telluria aromaticivorans TaxID=2725995 RepID=A0A7Y2JWD6_9BURK|nr:dicarboxylate transporter/tellurite-resistance protein TehA [Telluria aromaticivorans]NNG21633.1 dicarboxylate transporter/tellurite-resistance protein TehA [Telluria aromaticivorans]